MARLPPDAKSAAGEKPSRLDGFFRFPEFGELPRGRIINETFSLLIRAVVIFASALTLWSLGASAMRTAWLISPQGPLAADRLDTFDETVLLLLQLLRGVGGVAVICMVGGLVGAMIGFLFGIPRPVSASEAPPAGAGGAPAPAGINKGQVWQSSTNLTQVSDWLTKIIVGVSLVEANTIWTNFSGIVTGAAGVLFQYRHGSPAVLGGAALGGGVFGFLFCYLFTDIIIARLIVDADASLNSVPEAARGEIAAIGADDEVLGPRISRAPQLGTLPTPEQASAAMQVMGVERDKLTSRRDVKMWARAHAVMNDFKPAADGYMQLLGMPPDPKVPTDAALLLEAARVLYAAQRKPEAVVMAEQALRSLKTQGTVPLALKQAIIGDTVVLRLSGDVQGGWQDALRLIHDYLEDKDGDLQDDAMGRLHLLRALANGQKYKNDRSADLRKQIIDDLEFTLKQGKIGKVAIRRFWKPDHPDSGADDLAAFSVDDPDLKRLLDDPAPDPPNASLRQ
jgi:hypothetical protein